MLPQYQPPAIPGWTFVTNSDQATAIAAETEYRGAVSLAHQRLGRPEAALDVRVESFAVADDSEIKWAVYAKRAAL